MDKTLFRLKSFRGLLVLGVLLFTALPLFAAGEEAGPVLRVYGPGGPHRAMKAIGELYEKVKGVRVGVVKASPGELPKRLAADGDVFYTGAEYMLEEFVVKHPGVLDLATVEEVFERQVGIVLRKGNPLGIKGVECLHKDDVDFMVASLEKMDEFICPMEDNPARVPRRVYKGSDGAKAWVASPGIDAWLTYRTWYVTLQENAEFIELPCDNSLRHTMVAITHRTKNHQKAKEFIEFLKSAEAQRIFAEHGWD